MGEPSVTPNNLYPERPWEGKPSASPGLPPAPRRLQPPPVKTRNSVKPWLWLGSLAVIIGIVVVNANSGKPRPDFGPKTIAAAETISVSCDTAAAKAAATITALYADGGPEDKLSRYGGGPLTAADQATYDAVQAEIENADNQAVLPTLDACKTAAEWLGAAQRHLGLPMVTTSDAVNDASIATLCAIHGASEKPACADAAAHGVRP